MKIIIPISVGELLDKISILHIKSQHFFNEYVENELKDLTKIAKENNVYDLSYFSKLLEINKDLWEVEDQLRIFEKSKIFNKDFINLARSVYKMNDQRALIKKEINIKYESQYQEIKFYEN